MKNILLIIDSLNIGGAQRQIVNLAKSLTKEYKVTLLCYHPNTSYLENEIRDFNIPLIKVLKKSRFDLLFIVRLLFIIKKGKFDISISFLDTPNFYNEIAKLFRVVPKIIVSQRSAYFEGNITFKKRVLEYFHFLADNIVTNSITQKERSSKIFPLLKKKIFYVPNSYSFYKENEYHQVISNELVKFIVVSNTHHYKNSLALCKAVVKYKELYQKIDFSIDWYGRITESERDKVNFENGILELKNNELETVLKFKGTSNEVYNEIINADAIIHISDFEGCPNSVCEAMFLRKPVILSNVCDHPYLSSNNNGYLVDQKDPMSIAVTLRKFIQLDNLTKKQMGLNSYEFATGIMDEANVYKRWREIIGDE